MSAYLKMSRVLTILSVRYPQVYVYTASAGSLLSSRIGADPRRKADVVSVPVRSTELTRCSHGNPHYSLLLLTIV